MKNFLVFLFIFTLLEVISSWKLFHKERNGFLGEPFTEIESVPEEKYFDQRLDHFNPFSNETWKQRYFENGTFYKPGGPIFLMIGGEAEASPKWLVDGAWINFAKKYNAHCVLLEHRYYGKSHPTEDLSVKNLLFLSSEQALADIAWFITSFNSQRNFTGTPRWIAFGGSYPGSLAAWIRLKYPHLVHGAVSSSAPLLAIPDFKDYFRVVRDALATYNPNCVTSIEKGTKHLTSLLAHPLGQKSVTELFKLCDPLEQNNENDFANLYESLAANFAAIVQYDKDNRLTESEMKNITIDRACDVMMNKSLGDEINRLAEVNSLLLKATKEKCLDYKYDKMIKELRQVDWKSKSAQGTRQWTYQTCIEFGFFQTSSLNSTALMFGDKFPVEFFIKQCMDIYGAKFNMKLVKDVTEKANIMYGALNIQAENLVYIHGSTDPWHALGITKTLKVKAPAIFIKGTAHCADMYPPSPRDPPQLTAARKEIEKLIGEWLSQ